MFTLRYREGTPMHERRHAPCVAMFFTYAEAVAYLEDQPNSDVLEVVQR